ncbi:hypothetical protein ACQTO0_15310 [Brucella sp. NF 2815]|uniref:hypothetical protein n=1 Tax=Brucella sp. NF 2815 TaxID=3419592 RepID=UPI003D182322
MAVQVGHTGNDDALPLIVRPGQNACLNGANDTACNADAHIFSPTVRQQRLSGMNGMLAGLIGHSGHSSPYDITVLFQQLAAMRIFSLLFP